MFIFMFSCEDITTPDLGTNNQWIQFESSSLVVTESNPTPLKVNVLYAAATNESGIDVNFTYTSSQNDGFTVTPSNGVVSIPAGEFVGYIEVTPINDQVTNDDIVLNFSMENNSLPLGIAGEGLFNTTSEVTIVEDDCPLDLTQFVGTYSAEEDGQYFYEVGVTLDAVNQVLVLSNLYETGGFTVIALDNSDPNNPSIDFQSELPLYDAVLYVHSTYGNVYAVNPSEWSGDPSEDISTFRTCSQFMDLYFIRHVAAGYFTNIVNVKLFKN